MFAVSKKGQEWGSRHYMMYSFRYCDLLESVMTSTVCNCIFACVAILASDHTFALDDSNVR